MEDEQYEHTIWYECRLCYILLPQKYLIKNHLSESHSSELIRSPPPHLDQLLQDNPSSIPSHLELLSSDLQKTEVRATEDETSDMDLSCVKVEHSDGCSGYPEVEVLLGLEKIKTESDASTDSHGIKITSRILKPDFEIKDPSRTSDSLSSFWREVEFPDAIVRLQDCFKIPLPIVKKAGDKDEKCICIICYKVFSSKKSLKSHRKTHIGEKRFSCKTCSKRFAAEVNLQIHQLEHSDEWPTLQANPELLAKERRRLHLLRRRHRHSLYVFPTKLQCPYCPKTFPWDSTLQIHIRTHTKEKPYKCLECGSAYRQSDRLNLHKAQKVCQKVIEANLLKTVECEICHVRLKNEKGLQNHKSHMHKIFKPRKKVEEYICLFCGYNACSSNQLIRHNRSHTGEKPFKCLHCSQAFSIKGNMEQHMIRSCSVAKQRNITVLTGTSKKIRRQSNFRPSLDPEKTKKCLYCDERFILDSSRKYHEKVHGDKYPCKFCPTAFEHPMGLSLHIRRLHPDCGVGQVCAICNSQLASNSALRVHYLLVHDTKLPTVGSTKTKNKSHSPTSSKLSKTNSNKLQSLNIAKDPLAIGSEYSTDTTNFLPPTDI